MICVPACFVELSPFHHPKQKLAQNATLTCFFRGRKEPECSLSGLGTPFFASPGPSLAL